MYVAVKGGERAIESAHRLLEKRRRGNQQLPELEVAQLEQQLSLGVARVMAEASLYAPSLAALALKQARGDTIEAVFLLRAYRTTLPRFCYTRPLDTASMKLERRISATYKDLPGGQILGPTFDYTHRLLGASMQEDQVTQPLDPPAAVRSKAGDTDTQPGPAATNGAKQAFIEPDGRPNVASVADLLAAEGLVDKETSFETDAPEDITRNPVSFPCSRDQRLQALSRGDEGFLLSLAYSTQRGYGRTHPFVGEIRIGWVEIEIEIPELDLSVSIGEIQLTECQMINQFKGSSEHPPTFTQGYGLVFGHAERKAMAMSLLDRSLRADEYGEDRVAPAQDEEFVLAHADNVQASGFVEHLKLPHYVDFQAELELVRKLRREHAERISQQTLKQTGDPECPADSEQLAFGQSALDQPEKEQPETEQAERLHL